MIQSASWTNVTVLSKWTSKKGTKCTRVGWMTADGAGDHIFYGDDVYDAAAEGDKITITASQDGDFFRNIKVTGGALAASAPSMAGVAPDEQPATRRRRAS